MIELIQLLTASSVFIEVTLMSGSHRRFHGLSNAQVRKAKKRCIVAFFFFFLAGEGNISYGLLSPWLSNIMFYFFATRHRVHLPMPITLH